MTLAVELQIRKLLKDIRNEIGVSGVDGSGNLLMRDVVGNRDDDHSTGTLFGHLHDLWGMQHNVQKVYPSLAAPITVTAAGGVWTLGAFAEIVPANAIADEFHVHHLQIAEASVNGNYELRLYRVSTEIAQVTFSRTDKKDDVEGLIVVTPTVVTNSQIRAKLACSVGGATAKVKIWYYPH